MAQDAQEPRKRRFRILPKMPRVHRGELRATEEFRKLRAGMAATRHECPRDGTPMNLEDVYLTDAKGQIPEGTEPQRALVCPECGFSLPVSLMKEQLRQEAAPLKRAERQFTLFGFGILVLFGIVSILNGNLLTMIGALLLSLTLFVNALFFRYRHWQSVHGQLFLDHAPVRAWLREELHGKR